MFESIKVVSLFYVRSMPKKSLIELFEDNYQKLVQSLPMKDDDFLEKLKQHKLLPEDVEKELKLFHTPEERARYYLDNVIKPTSTSKHFSILLTILQESKYRDAAELANIIESELYIRM